MPEKIKQFNTIQLLRKIIIVFFAVGAIGMLVPFSRPLFQQITPLALILSLALLLWFQPNYNFKTIAIFVFVALAGFWLEVLGVNTGIIFGNYKYGDALGPKLFETPYMLGINWLLMIYLTASITDHFRFPVLMQIAFGSALMIVYDIVLEIVAPRMNMWSFDEGIVPFKNYLTWFVLSLFFHTIIRLFKVRTKNPLAVTIYIVQILFFVLLIFFKKPL